MAQPVRTGYEVHEEVGSARPSLRIFQALTGIAGAVLFVAGLVAVFGVDFGGGLLDTSASVMGIGFSPVAAIAAIVLGGAILVAAVADQDRGGAGIAGLVTLLAGVAALVAERQVDGATVDRGSAALFITVGAVVFVLSLVPWWSGRHVRTTTVPH